MEVLQEGQQIRHNLYGLGVVTESDEDRTTVEFDEHGQKKFVTSIMNAELVGDQLMKPRGRRRRKAVKKETAKKEITH